MVQGRKVGGELDGDTVWARQSVACSLAWEKRRERGPVKLTPEACANMSSAHRARWAALRETVGGDGVTPEERVRRSQSSLKGWAQRREFNGGNGVTVETSTLLAARGRENMSKRASACKRLNTSGIKAAKDKARTARELRDKVRKGREGTRTAHPCGRGWY